LTTGTENISGLGYYAYNVFCVSDTKDSTVLHTHTNRRGVKMPTGKFEEGII
jgi:hypothetical protein